MANQTDKGGVEWPDGSSGPKHLDFVPTCPDCVGQNGADLNHGHLPGCSNPMSCVERVEVVPKHLYEQERERAEKSERSREFTQQWYAERISRITDTAKREGIWPEIACILANGTASPGEAPTYAQLLNSAKHRAEAAELRLGEVEAALERLEVVADELDSEADDCQRWANNHPEEKAAFDAQRHGYRDSARRLRLALSQPHNTEEEK